jgi:hypothetical protein
MHSYSIKHSWTNHDSFCFTDPNDIRYLYELNLQPIRRPPTLPPVPPTLSPPPRLRPFIDEIEQDPDNQRLRRPDRYKRVSILPVSGNICM